MTDSNGRVDDKDGIASAKELVVTQELDIPNQIFGATDESLMSGPKSVRILDINETFKFKGVLIEEEKSVFQKGGTLKLQEAIPIIPKKVAVFCLVLNFLCPGLGTIVSGFAAIFCPCDPYMCKRWFEILLINITAGIFQLATMCYFLIGYFWGIYWGILMVQKAPSSVQQKRFKVDLFQKKKHSYVSRK